MKLGIVSQQLLLPSNEIHVEQRAILRLLLALHHHSGCYKALPRARGLKGDWWPHLIDHQHARDAIYLVRVDITRNHLSQRSSRLLRHG